MEQHYVFLKNNIVEQIAVFASQNEELADRVAQEHGFDDAVWVGEDKPHLFSTYDSKSGKFTEPSDDLLFERGIISETNAMIKAREEAEAAAQEATPTE